MGDFGINEMLEMQKALQEKYKDKWRPICPERGQDQLLWMIGEIGEVIDIIKKYEVGELIVGLPLNMDGTEGEMTEKVKAFCDELLKKYQIKITYQDERLTSVEAEDILIRANYRREKRRQVLDSIAATIILQSYLDYKK